MGSPDPILQPLPRLDTEMLEGTRFDRLLERIPIVGWIWADVRWRLRAFPLIREVHTRLAIRPTETLSLFGEAPSLQHTAATLATIAAQVIGWPSDRFLPDDPLATILWAHEDGLDDTSAILAMENEFGVELPMAWLETMWTGSWGDFVNAIHRKRFPCGFGSADFAPDSDKA